MADLVHIIGSSPYGVSKYQQSLLAYWTAILIQRNHALADSEGNLLGTQLAQASQRTWAGLGGAGLLALCTPGASGTANVARLHAGAATLQALIGGTLVDVRGATDGATLDVLLSAPPSSGERTDMIYLEVWQEEIQPTISPEAASSVVYKRGNTSNATPLTNDLVVVASTETARRLQVRYAIKSAPAVLALSSITAATYPYIAGPVVGEYLAGDGSLSAGQALGSADGYKHAIVLATVLRTAGVTTIAALDIAASAARLVVLSGNADAVDTFSASATPVLNQLIPLDSTGKYPAAVFTGLVSSATDVDTVDTYHAASPAAANKLLPLSGAVKYPNSVLRTGSGKGLDADKVDAFHASATPGPSLLLALDGSAKVPNSVLQAGTGNALDADTVDTRHAVAVPAAGALLALDSAAKYPNTTLRMGSGNGINADKVDNADTTALAGSATYTGKLLILDSGGKFPNTSLKMGGGQGIDADKLDGLHGSSYAAPTHAIGATLIPRVATNGVIDYQFPAGRNISLNCWYVVREFYNANTFLDIYLTMAERDSAGNMVALGLSFQDSGFDVIGMVTHRAINMVGSFFLTNPANYFYITGNISSGNFVVQFIGISIYSWYC